MTDHIEDRLLKLAGEAEQHLRDGVVRCDHLGDALSPEVVAAMCRVVAAARRIGHHILCDYVNALGECDCQIGTALGALAPLDAMEGKVE